MAAVSCHQCASIKQFEDVFDKSRKRSIFKNCPSQPLMEENFHDVLQNIDTFIFDADGVLWLAEDVLPDSNKFLDYLLEQKKNVIVLTNNATKSRCSYAKKLKDLGFKELNRDNVVNPAVVAADLLHRKMPKGKKVYLIASKGIREELDNVGIQYFGHGPEETINSDDGTFPTEIDVKEKPEDVGAVLVGYEKHFNYTKLMKAANYLSNNPECLFVATNEDETYPGPNPRVTIPDAGPVVAAVKVASGKKPITVGKPCSPAFEYISRKWKIDPSRTMMIGDRTNTDIKFGKTHGLKTMLVLSGCHHLEEVVANHKNNHMDMVPDYFAACLGALLEGHTANERRG